MMSIGSFWDSVNSFYKILNSLSISKEFQKTKRGEYSQEFLNIMYHNFYNEIYDVALNNFDYDILLNDDSFFQFSFRNENVSMAFYPKPIIYKSYKDFITDIYNEDLISMSELELFEFENNTLSDGDFYSEYEQYLLEKQTLSNIVPLRFDFDNKYYHPVYHPLCHLHIGCSNDIRIAFDKHPTPHLFGLFVLKNYYPNSFFDIDEVKNKIINPKIVFPDKKTCIDVSAHKFIDEDKIFYFT
jgi:hypothetical protein